MRGVIATYHQPPCAWLSLPGTSKVSAIAWRWSAQISKGVDDTSSSTRFFTFKLGFVTQTAQASALAFQSQSQGVVRAAVKINVMQQYLTAWTQASAFTQEARVWVRHSNLCQLSFWKTLAIILHTAPRPLRMDGWLNVVLSFLLPHSFIADECVARWIKNDESNDKNHPQRLWFSRGNILTWSCYCFHRGLERTRASSRGSPPPPPPRRGPQRAEVTPGRTFD